MTFIFISLPIIIAVLFFIPAKNKILRYSIFTIRIFAILIYTLLSLRLYWFDIYKIPTGSMQHTLDIGDKIIIRKGTLPKNNDVVVFKMRKWSDPMTIVKRCIGIPGDSITMRLDSIFVNDTYLPESPSMQWAYCFDSVRYSSDVLASTLFHPVNCWKDRGRYNIGLTKGEYKKVRSELTATHITSATLKPSDDGNVFPWTWYLKNNWSNIKPFYVPRKGDTVKFNKANKGWCFRVIESENENVEVRNDSIYIDGKLINSYTYKHSYYYMLGDNRYQSQDSRIWGFVREDYILGNVVLKISQTPFKISVVR